MTDHLAHCMDLLKAGDRERYLTVLYAPEQHRPALAALYAFNLQTARIRDLVSEPLPGEIRLQWWREALSGEREGEGRQNPVSAALIEAIAEYGLPLRAFDNCLEARVFDLYNDPMPDRETLEGYLGETVSMIFQLSAHILNGGDDPGSADAAGHAGVAFGLADLLRQAPLHRHRRQVFVPGEVLDAAGTDAAAWIRGDDMDAAGRVVSILAAMGREHLASADAAIAGLARPIRAAFIHLAVTGPLLAKAAKKGGEAATSPVSLSPLKVQWLLLRRAMRR